MKTSTLFSDVSKRMKRFLIILLLVAILVPQKLSAAGTFYWGGGAANAWNTSNWSTTNAAPYATAYVNASDAYFNLASSQITGPTAFQSFTSITANENGTMTKATPTSGNLAPVTSLGAATIAPITVALGKVLDFGTQGFATTAGSGLRKEGIGELRISGILNCLPGGFVLNEGILTTVGVNSAGVGTLTINGGILATTGARTMNSAGITIGGNFTFGANTYSTDGNNTLVGDASKDLTFAATAPVSLGTSAARTITFGGGGKLILNGVISGSGSSITIAGSTSGGLTLGGANTYDGGTTITSGTLLLAAAGVLADNGSITLNGGILKTTTTFSETMGTLALTNNSTIALTTGVNTLTFANASGWTSGKTLTITGWTGTPGATGTAGKIFVGNDATGLTVDQLAQISFTGFGAGALILSTGEVVPASGASLTPPALTAATGATVDGSFDITFTDDPAWRAAITAVTISASLTPITAGVVISAGKITITPATASSSSLRVAGTKSIGVIATGYSNVYPLYQALAAGVATKLGITTQPAAPASNGATLAVQPVVAVQDQFGNTITTSTASVEAAVGAGTWTLGGTTAVAAVAGITTFSGLTATSAAAETGASITFTSAGLTPITSGILSIPAPVATELSHVDVSNFIDVQGKTIITSETGKICIYNVQGKLIITGQNTNRMDTNLESGLYIVHFTNKNGKSNTNKIVIQ